MKRDLKFLNIPFEIKADKGDELIITGYGAVKGNIDSYKDVIVDGAFTKTLKERGDRIAFCLQHDIYNPIGKILDIKEDAKGLALDVRISDSEAGIKTKVREGILKEMSIGYSVMDMKKGEQDGEEVNFLTEIKLYEVSLVTIAANPEAMIEGMKSEDQSNKDFISDEFDRILSVERNENKKYEILKLKALILSLPLDSKGVETPPKDESTVEDEPQLTKDDILNILNS